jgi:two-component system response regulator AtoC
VSVRVLLEGMLIGESLAMCRLRSLIERIAPTHLPVLIEGPTGSGKELVAHATHVVSGRKGAFVPFNVCAIPDTMFEDALFGHVRGAFTGAVYDSPGFLTQANDGTAFFDEVSGLPPAAQAKLLRAIETREFRPVGSRRDVRSNFRLVAATNVCLERLQQQSLFREDLRHRFGKIVLTVPALTERREDIARLATHFLATSGLARTTDISARALARLHDYDWPGNVRELKAVVESAAILAPNGRIETEDIAPMLTAEAARRPVQLEFEIRRTIDVLREVRGDVTAAAQSLGVNKTTVYRRLRRARIGIDVLTAPVGAVAGKSLTTARSRIDASVAATS